MTDAEARKAARRKLREEGIEAVEIESHDRVVRLEDPPGYAVEAWIYVMDEATA